MDRAGLARHELSESVAATRTPWRCSAQQAEFRSLPLLVIISSNGWRRDLKPRSSISITRPSRCSWISSQSAQLGRGPECPSSVEIGRKNDPVFKSARFQIGLPPDGVSLLERAGDCRHMATAARKMYIACDFIDAAA